MILVRETSQNRGSVSQTGGRNARLGKSGCDMDETSLSTHLLFLYVTIRCVVVRLKACGRLGSSHFFIDRIKSSLTTKPIYRFHSFLFNTAAPNLAKHTNIPYKPYLQAVMCICAFRTKVFFFCPRLRTWS